MKTVPDILETAAALYRQKNQEYGDNYKRTGFIFQRLFPNGVNLETPDDFNRFSIMVLLVVKITRYAINFENGHKDSLDDLCVYSAMLRELDDANLSD